MRLWSMIWIYLVIYEIIYFDVGLTHQQDGALQRSISYPNYLLNTTLFKRIIHCLFQGPNPHYLSDESMVIDLGSITKPSFILFVTVVTEDSVQLFSFSHTYLSVPSLKLSRLGEWVGYYPPQRNLSLTAWMHGWLSVRSSITSSNFLSIRNR